MLGDRPKYPVLAIAVAVSVIDGSVVGDPMTVDHTPYEASSNASSATGDRGRGRALGRPFSVTPLPHMLLFGELPSSAKDGSIGIP